MIKYFSSPSFIPGLQNKKAVFDHTIEVQGVLFNNDIRSSIYQTAQSALGWGWGGAICSAVPEPKRAELCSASSFRTQAEKNPNFRPQVMILKVL